MMDDAELDGPIELWRRGTTGPSRLTGSSRRGWLPRSINNLAVTPGPLRLA